MRIEKLEITGFGRFSNESFMLGPGFNIVFGPNEAGKSTLLAFIKGMLYGLRGGRADRDGTPPQARAFKPWNGAVYCGAMEYSLDGGGRYRVVRNFTTGSAKVYDSSFNDITGSFPAGREHGPQFAEAHLGIGAECFERTVLVRQMECRISGGPGDDLLERLNNASQTGFDDISLTKAVDALQEARKAYVGTGRTSTRPLDRVISRIDELSGEKKCLAELRDSLNGVARRLHEAHTEMETLQDRKAFLEKAGELISVHKAVDAGKRRISFLAGILKDVCARSAELNTAVERISYIDPQASHRPPAYAGRSRRASAGRHAGSFSRLLLLAGICIAAALIVIGGWASGALPDKCSGPAAAAGAFLFGTAGMAVFMMLRYKMRGKESFDKTWEQGANSTESIFLSKRILELGEDIRSLLDRAASECGKPCRDGEALQSAICDIEEELKNDLGMLDAAAAENPALSEYMTAMAAMTAECGAAGRWKTDGDTNTAQINELRLVIKECETLLAASGYDDDRLQRIEEELLLLEDEKAELSDLDRSLSIAAVALLEAGADMRKDFAPALNARMAEIMSGLTGGRYTDMRVDKDFHLKALAAGMPDVIAAGLLSAGTADQAYLALRVAAAGLLTSSGESLPFLLDEIFAHYDDARICDAMAFLSGISASSQVLFFTCKRREAELALEACRDARILDLTV